MNYGIKIDKGERGQTETLSIFSSLEKFGRNSINWSLSLTTKLVPTYLLVHFFNLYCNNIEVNYNLK